MSIFLSSKDHPSQLPDIIAAADAMNHAIPTATELSASISKLLTLEIIIETELGFVISKRHLQSLASAYAKPGGLFKTPSKGTKWLSKNWSSSFNITKLRSITDEEISIAYKAYQNRSGGDA